MPHTKANTQNFNLYQLKSFIEYVEDEGYKPYVTIIHPESHPGIPKHIVDSHSRLDGNGIRSLTLNLCSDAIWPQGVVIEHNQLFWQARFGGREEMIAINGAHDTAAIVYPKEAPHVAQSFSFEGSDSFYLHGLIESMHSQKDERPEVPPSTATPPAKSSKPSLKLVK